MRSSRALLGAATSLATAGVATFALAADDPLPPPAYKLNGEPHTGSNIAHAVVTGGSGIPLNRRYDELTPEERRRVARWYEAMPDGDEPPFPADGLGPLYSALQKVASHERERGEWTFIVAVDPTGMATDVSLARGEAGIGVRDMATALMLTKFKPARCAGQPCAMSFPVRFRMTRGL